jgi:hypothetical protein
MYIGIDIYIWLFLTGGQKTTAPIIGRTCAFDAKIYKIVDTIFAVSAYAVWNKKFFKIPDFSFQLPSLLIDFLEKILPSLTENHEN